MVSPWHFRSYTANRCGLASGRRTASSLLFSRRTLKTMAYYFPHGNCPSQQKTDMFSGSVRAKLVCAETFWRHDVTLRSRRLSVPERRDFSKDSAILQIARMGPFTDMSRELSRASPLLLLLSNYDAMHGQYSLLIAPEYSYRMNAWSVFREFA